MNPHAHSGSWSDDIGVGAVLDDAYRLTRQISEGAMGTVFEAVQLRLNKRVALKIMVAELAMNPEALARFRREVEVTCQLGHPHVIQLLDYGTTLTGQPYLVMEFLEGEDLEQRLYRVGRMPLVEVVELVRQVASAVSHIHEQGIVHRDLKPANVFLLPRDLSGDFVKVVDFGISRVAAAENKLTQAYTMVGTPEGMSPEQATGMVDQVDARSDQWALACMCWRMLDGARPFPGMTLGDIIRQIVNEDPAPLHPAADCPLPVEQVLRKALSKRQDDRFPSVAAFWRAFEDAARPPSRPLARTPVSPAPAVAVPRKPTVVTFGLLSLVSVVAGATMFYAADRLHVFAEIQKLLWFFYR